MPTAVVTGAGRGLGRLVAQRLARRGLTVIITDIDGDAAEAAAREIGGDAHGVQQDVRDADSHRRVAQAASERGPIQVWVNNAGVLRTDTTWAQPEADVRMTVDVDLYGVIWGSRAAVDAMSESGGGHLINLASMSSLAPVPGLSVYGAAKAAVLSFSVSLQGELENAKLPIRVSAICPDSVETDLIRGVQDSEHSSLAFSAGKLLDPEHVADVIVGVLDHPELVVTVPRVRGALAHVFRPFPELGLKALRIFHSRGESHRRKRSTK